MREREAKIQLYATHTQAIVGFATLAINSIILTNSAAAGTVLAFLGTIWGKPALKEAIAPASHSLIIFAVGATAAIASACFSYVAQLSYSRFQFRNKGEIVARCFHILAMVAAALGVAAFIYGVMEGLVALNSLSMSSTVAS